MPPVDSLKKRGRPPKAKSSPVLVDGIVKRGRGRPRGSKNLSSTRTYMNNDAKPPRQKLQAMRRTDLVARGRGRGRGRPRRVENHNISSSPMSRNDSRGRATHALQKAASDFCDSIILETRKIVADEVRKILDSDEIQNLLDTKIENSIANHGLGVNYAEEDEEIECEDEEEEDEEGEDEEGEDEEGEEEEEEGEEGEEEEEEGEEEEEEGEEEEEEGDGEEEEGDGEEEESEEGEEEEEGEDGDKKHDVAGEDKASGEDNEEDRIDDKKKRKLRHNKDMRGTNDKNTKDKNEVVHVRRVAKKKKVSY